MWSIFLKLFMSYFILFFILKLRNLVCIFRHRISQYELVTFYEWLLPCTCSSSQSYLVQSWLLLHPPTFLPSTSSFSCFSAFLQHSPPQCLVYAPWYLETSKPRSPSLSFLISSSIQSLCHTFIPKPYPICSH